MLRRCTRRIILQKARRHPSAGSYEPVVHGLRLLVGVGVQALFHSPLGVLFTFPSRYSFTIGGQASLALEGGPPRFPQDVSCPVVLRNSPQHPRTPWRRVRGGLGSSRFARHYYGNLVLISLPRGTEMFQFPRCPWSCLCIQHAMRPLARSRVAPFGFAWLIARLQLPRHVSPLSAPFFGTWPHRHPPYTLLRLAILVRSVFLCSSPAQQPSIRAYPQRENSLRFGKIEVNLDIRL